MSKRQLTKFEEEILGEHAVCVGRFLCFLVAIPALLAMVLGFAGRFLDIGSGGMVYFGVGFAVFIVAMYAEHELSKIDDHEEEDKE